jgi:hypothetical protein
VYLENCALNRGIDGIALTASVGAIAALGGAGAVILGQTLNIQLLKKGDKSKQSK